MKAAGERALLTYDPAPGQVVTEGDYIRTGTGRTYLVDKARRQQEGKHAGRYLLATTVMPDDHQTEPDAVVHLLAWYRR